MSQEYRYTYDVFGNISGVFPIEDAKTDAKPDEQNENATPKQCKKVAK